MPEADGWTSLSSTVSTKSILGSADTIKDIGLTILSSKYIVSLPIMFKDWNIEERKREELFVRLYATNPSPLIGHKK